TDEHVEIAQLGGSWRISGRNHLLDHQERPARIDGATAVAQRHGGTRVVPVVDHAREHVRVPATGDLNEYVPPYHLAAVEHPGCREMPCRALGHRWAIEEDAPEPRRGAEDGGEQHAVAPTDIDQRLERREVVRPDHGVDDLAHSADHRLIKGVT